MVKVCFQYKNVPEVIGEQYCDTLQDAEDYIQDLNAIGYGAWIESSY